MLAEPDPAAKSLLWLTAREILTNACRHACASHLEVVLSECHEGYRVTVRDDGRGFTPADAMRVRPGHIGLSTASARLQTHGGALRVSRAAQTAGRRSRSRFRDRRRNFNEWLTSTLWGSRASHRRFDSKPEPADNSSMAQTVSVFTPSEVSNGQTPRLVGERPKRCRARPDRRR